MAAARNYKPVRESVTTIAEDGSRNFLRPADVQGRVTLLRRLFAVALIAIYVLLPWIQVNGYPAVFFDVAGRRFHLMGLTLAAQDIWLFFFFITGLGFTLFFVTALFGRLWCGWACPHTVFLEHVYRRIERLLEGPVSRQKELDALSWGSPRKLLCRGAKHVLFIVVSAAIAHMFLAYFVSIPKLYDWMQHSPMQHWGSFVFIIVATGLLYFNFSWFREQLCLIICPYGRLQSALTDDDTLVVGYDELRGEPRGKPGMEGVGDCINCSRCVQVCPTGIDIRQGYQMECVGCMSCIDACNEVMDKLDRPRGLVRYASANQRARKSRRFLRPRVFVYFFLMLVGASVMGFSFSTYGELTMSVTRMRGMPFYVREKTVQNPFNVRVLNKSAKNERYHISVASEQAGLKVLGVDDEVEVASMAEEVRAIVLSVPKDDYKGRFAFEVVVTSEDGKELARKQATFVGPEVMHP